jgi:hypothetical protein
MDGQKITRERLEAIRDSSPTFAEPAATAAE